MICNLMNKIYVHIGTEICFVCKRRKVFLENLYLLVKDAVIQVWEGQDINERE